MNKLVLGTVQLGLRYGINNLKGLVTNQESYDILSIANDNGIKTLDTAADYGDSEIKIGNFISKQNKKSFEIITKFSKKEGVGWKKSLNNSLKKMNVPNVDIIMFHSFEAYINAKNNNEIDSILKFKGSLFNKLGVSVYTNDELKMLKTDENIEVIQSPFNILDNENIRGHILKALKDDGKIVHTRSAFLQGLFFMEHSQIPRKLMDLISPLKEINNIAEQNDFCVGHLALQYVLSKDYIDGVLIGVESIDQLQKNIQWAKTNIPFGVLEKIDKKIHIQNSALLNPSLW
jgi:aryl-alcohol dehydrogenase-like predicted oxidoreductase